MTKILIADDSPTFLQTLKQNLEAENYEIVGEANNGSVAVEKYKELKPDILILDILMPKTSGIQALKEILEFDSDAKIIAMSALDKMSIKEEALNSGAKDFLLKPFPMDDLFSSIDELI